MLDTTLLYFGAWAMFSWILAFASYFLDIHWSKYGKGVRWAVTLMALPLVLSVAFGEAIADALEYISEEKLDVEVEDQ